MGSDSTRKTGFLSLPSSSLSCIHVKFKRYYRSFNELEQCSNSHSDQSWTDWKNPAAISRIGSNNCIDNDRNFANHRTISSALSSPLKNDVLHGNDKVKDEESNNESKNDESFTSVLTSSIGSNVSKSFDWAIETSTVESCRNPFEYYCFPVYEATPTARKQAVFARHRRHKTGDCIYEMRQSLISESEDENEEEEKEDDRPFIPFTLPLHCEYCGSPSIRNCQKFDPECQRPETFFPKAKPPFSARTKHTKVIHCD